MTESPIDPVANFRAIRNAVDEAAREAGRGADEVRITAVSKGHDAARIRPVLEMGHRIFGENRVQEAQAKWPDLRAAHPDIELRLIGPLQTNKVKDAVALFDVIETLDRPKLARAIAAEAEKQGRAPRLFIQVNIGEEPQKAGIAPLEADDFIRQCREEWGLKIEGLMCIPPAGEPPAPFFALLAKIAARNDLAALSMGMSADYEIAAQMGADYVRVGSAIFGPRPMQNK